MPSNLAWNLDEAIVELSRLSPPPTLVAVQAAKPVTPSRKPRNTLLRQRRLKMHRNAAGARLFRVG